MIWGMPSMLYPQYEARLEPFLTGFAERGQNRVTAGELAQRIMDRDAQVWVVDDFTAVCMTSVYQEFVEINFCAGTGREDWQDELETVIAAWARELGKGRLIMVTRPGWSKWAKMRGYALAHVELVRNLSDGR